METFSVFYLVSVWGGAHSVVCLEYGKHETSQKNRQHGRDLDITGRILLKLVK
jgi:hypothetical protein